MEIELKLLLDASDNERLCQHRLLAEHGIGAPRQATLLARYFDTPDLYLRRHDAGLRVRKMNGNWIQTMKAGGSVQAGLHQRHEWEGPVKHAWPQLGQLKKAMDADTDWVTVLDAPGLAQRLQPLFSVRVERRTWDLRVGDAEIEMVLDVGAVEHGSASDPINEIELELKSGRPAILFEFALQLTQDLQLRLSNSSKAERGYALCSQSGTSVYKAEPVQLAPDDDVQQALRAIIGNCLVHIQANEAGVLQSDNAESLHQMRVGVRRLRSALKLFAPCIPCPEQLQDDIAWLGSALGSARDWEVLSTTTLTRASPAVTASKHVMALQALLARRAQQQREQAVAALASPRYTHLLLTLGAWLLEAGEQNALVQRQLVRSFARIAVGRQQRKLMRRGGKIKRMRIDALHRIRIATKQTRYTLEFFQSLYRGKRVRPYLAALSALQEELGYRQDLVVADQLLLQLEMERPDAASTIAFVRGYLLAQQTLDQRALQRAWKAWNRLALPAPR